MSPVVKKNISPSEVELETSEGLLRKMEAVVQKIQGLQTRTEELELLMKKDDEKKSIVEVLKKINAIPE
jgi:hypothetical protein